MAWHGIWYDLVGMVRYMVWPGGHGMVYVIAWRGMAWHGIWYVLAGMAWFIVWPGGHGMVCGMA